MKNRYLKYLNIFFIVFFFPSFITGIFIPNLVYGIFLLSHVILNFKKIKKLIFKFSFASCCFIFFCAIIIISSIISKYSMHSLESSALYFTYLIYSLVIYSIFSDNKKFRHLFFICGIFTCFTLSFDAIYEFFNGYNLLGYSSIDGRLAGMFGGRWVLGRYLIYFLPILVGLYYLEIDNYKKYKVIIYTTFILTSLVIIFSGERAALLMFFIYIFLLLFYFLNKLTLVKILQILFLIIVLVILPFLFSDTSERIRNNFLVYLLSTDVEINQYLSMFITSWKMFIDNPLFGIGPNNFRYVCSESMYFVSKWSCSTHPHSITFQVLAEIGLLGFIAVYSVLGFFIYKSIILIFSKNLSKSSFGMYSLQSSIIIYLFPFMITGNFFLSWYGFIYYLPISLYMVYSSKID